MSNSATIQSLIDSASSQPSIFLERRSYIRVPPGVYDVDETIIVNKVVDLDMRGVTLEANEGTDVIRIETPGNFSLVYGMVIVGDLHGQWAGHPIGVDVQAHGVSIRDVFIHSVGTGIRWWGSLGQGTNANKADVRKTDIFGCYEYGIHLKGGDCNNGSFDNIDIVGSGRTKHAILDESFLGNSFHTIHASTTREEAYALTAVANYGTWTGCYLENDCGTDLPPDTPKIKSVSSRATWVGGNAIFHVKVGDRFGAGMSKAIFVDETPDGDTLAVTLPHGADYSYGAFRHTSADPEEYPSGGIEFLIRRRRKTKTIDFATRVLGAVKAVWSFTRADHPMGPGKAIMQPKVKPVTAEHVLSGAQLGSIAIPDTASDPTAFLPTPSKALELETYSTRNNSGTLSYVCTEVTQGTYEWVQV